jgi:hypothetical protein
MSEDKNTSEEPTEPTKHSPEEPTEPTPSDPYHSAIQTMRDTAKWLATAVAAVAAALLAGTQLSSLGEFDWKEPRLVIALVFGAVALILGGIILWYTTRVLTPEWDSIPSLIKDEKAGTQNPSKMTHDIEWIQKNKFLLDNETYNSVEELYSHYKQCKKEDKERKRLYQVLMNLIFAVQAERIRRQLDRAQKVMFGLGLFAALGIFVFVWAANPPTAEDAARPDSGQSQLSKRVANQQRVIDSLSSRIDTLDQKVEDQQREISSLSSRVDTLDQEVSSNVVDQTS